MKLLLSAFCATIIASPLAFADCGKCKGDKEKKEETTLIAGKCKKKCDGEKDEATLLAGKCKKECDKEEKDEATLLAGKCKKDCDKEEKDEATLMAA